MNSNSFAAIRFLVDNKLKLLKLKDIKMKISEFKQDNEINADFKIFDLNGKELSDDAELEAVFAGKTNVDMNSCMIKIQDPSKENK